jgi:hypothetical protein
VYALESVNVQNMYKIMIGICMKGGKINQKTSVSEGGDCCIGQHHSGKKLPTMEK